MTTKKKPTTTRDLELFMVHTMLLHISNDTDTMMDFVGFWPLRSHHANHEWVAAALSARIKTLTGVVRLMMEKPCDPDGSDSEDWYVSENEDDDEKSVGGNEECGNEECDSSEREEGSGEEEKQCIQ